MQTSTKNSVLNNIKIGILALLLTIGIGTVYGDWTAPPSTPPTCPTSTPGCNAPLHIGADAQTKLGGVVLGSGLPGTGMALYVPTGRVGIGNSSPTQKLDVTGYIKASTGFCIGSSCITSWPSGAEGSKIAVYSKNVQVGDTVSFTAPFSPDVVEISYTGSAQMGGTLMFVPGTLGSSWQEWSFTAGYDGGLDDSLRADLKWTGSTIQVKPTKMIWDGGTGKVIITAYAE